jgi:hypothetical protein
MYTYSIYHVAGVQEERTRYLMHTTYSLWLKLRNISSLMVLWLWFRNMGQPDDALTEIHDYGERLPVSVVPEFQEHDFI